MMIFDPWEVRSVVTGSLRLDGGGMFGVVPKTLWESVADADEDNRILLATRTLLAVDRSAGRVMLVDTGCGTKWPADLAHTIRRSLRPQRHTRRAARVGPCRSGRDRRRRVPTSTLTITAG